MENVTVIGLIAAACTTFAYLPQAVKTIKTKHTKDLSIYMLVLLEIGLALWLIYGLMINDIPIIAANSVTILFVSVTLVMKIKHG